MTFDSSNIFSVTIRCLSKVTKGTLRQSSSSVRTCNTSNQ